jgi:uncharacterized membrane protein YqjE
MRLLGIVRDAGGTLLDQAALHAELLRVEWAEEKVRLRQMAAALLVGFACLLALLFALGVLLLSVYWDTAFRVPAIATLIALYALGAALAWRRFRAQAARGDDSFAASRTELAADLQLLRSQM